MFYSVKLNKIKNLRHCFFTRKNGFSDGLYKSLNCGLGSNDKKINVIKNLEFVSKQIGCKQEALITLNQKHTDQVILFSNESDVKNKLTGDSIISVVKNIGIGILTADCAPILFYDPNKKIIGCAHSGWQGALNGIIENTVKKFNELKSNTHDLVVVVGPCLSQDSYEVQNDFLNKFTNNDKKNIKFFKKNNDTSYNFDLRGFINNKLHNLGIKNIDNIKMDTFSKSEFFYSYRRSCHNNENDYGRCISVILMT